MKPLYVRTNDFRLAHRLLSEFKQRDLPAKQGINDPIDTEAYWFGTADEVESTGDEELPLTQKRWRKRSQRGSFPANLPEPPNQLIVGVDPGPRPGCAFFADGMSSENGSWNPLKKRLTTS